MSNTSIAKELDGEREEKINNIIFTNCRFYLNFLIIRLIYIGFRLLKQITQVF